MALLHHQRPQSRLKIGQYVMTRANGTTEVFGVLSETFLSMTERDSAGVRHLEKGGIFVSSLGWSVRRKS